MTCQSIQPVIYMDTHMLLHALGGHKVKWSSLYTRYFYYLLTGFKALANYLRFNMQGDNSMGLENQFNAPSLAV